VIRARIASVTASCAACCLTTYVILARLADASVPDALHLMGLWPIGLPESLRAVYLTSLLFAGPLFLYLVVDAGWRDWLSSPTSPGPLRDLWTEWTAWRNYVAGPVTEEVLFRTASVPLMLIARATLKETIFLSPVIFGLAHVHHFYEFRLSYPRVPATAALLRSVFQFSFTTLFGAYATFLFVRTGSLLAVCAVHALCNSMGLPKVWGRVEPPAAVQEGQGQGEQQRRASVLWTVAYYVILVAGAVLFYNNLWSLTESPGGNALVPSEAFGRRVA